MEHFIFGFAAVLIFMFIFHTHSPLLLIVGFGYGIHRYNIYRKEKQLKKLLEQAKKLEVDEPSKEWEEEEKEK